MKQKIESNPKSSQSEFGLDYRTEEELIESIRQKRKTGTSLDAQEAELVARQMREEKEDRDNTYRR